MNPVASATPFWFVSVFVLRYWQGGNIERVWKDEGFTVDFTYNHKRKHAQGFKIKQLQAIDTPAD